MLNVAAYIVSNTDDACFIIVIKYMPWACPELPDKCLPRMVTIRNLHPVKPLVFQ